MRTIKTDVKAHEAAYCYTAQFAKGASTLLAMGMTGLNQVQIFDTSKQDKLCA